MPTSSDYSAAITQTLADHGVSAELGFLMPPAAPLPDKYAPWVTLAAKLTPLLAIGGVRAEVAKLPVLETTELGNDEAWLFQAKHLLTIITQAYVFGEKNTATSLPPQIACPLTAVSEKLGVPPILSYMDYVLTNWELIDPDQPFTLSNIRVRTGLNGGTDEAWFILIHAAIEQEAGAIIRDCMEIRLAGETGSIEDITTILPTLTGRVRHLRKTFLRMKERCDPHVYFLRVRPFTHGWHNNPAFPDGMTYEGVDAWVDQPQSFRGETGAQSSVVPFIDASLGIAHPNDKLNEHLIAMRDYMPARHRALLEWAEKSPLRGMVADLAERSELSPAESKLIDVYNEACAALTEFRTSHMQIAHDYVYAHRNTAIESSANPASVGTGGTPPMDYLRHHRDYTDAATVKRPH